MAIIVNIDLMRAKRKMSVTELAGKVGIAIADLSILKNGRACRPGDILEFMNDSRQVSAPVASPTPSDSCISGYGRST